MQNELTNLNESSDFICPNCGISAFEVESSRWNYVDETDGEEFLVLKCLHCLQLFQHTLHGKESCLISTTPRKHFF